MGYRNSYGKPEHESVVCAMYYPQVLRGSCSSATIFFPLLTRKRWSEVVKGAPPPPPPHAQESRCRVSVESLTCVYFWCSRPLERMTKEEIFGVVACVPLGV